MRIPTHTPHCVFALPVMTVMHFKHGSLPDSCDCGLQIMWLVQVQPFYNRWYSTWMALCPKVRNLIAVVAAEFSTKEAFINRAERLESPLGGITLHLLR